MFGIFSRLQGQNNVEIVITGFKSDEGKAVVALYNTGEQFLENAYKAKTVDIKNGQVKVEFENISDGVYAVSSFHDENEDKEFNMLMGFWPLENYATSNNAPARFGPPQWEDAKFEVKNKEKVTQKIKMM
ncbi:DUF2141 domain-containing protein [Zunongwangia sp. F260]|uniref:DUF2141 domain-containing protein n=1 Tax=Autumnicola lenta TaxID=3075593 RepID=A0ABU3CLV2_9FLAO|nr:DUF2141 domain-containing protein [Zunongwangia sp. F260]MDT0647328.1 DUF2141 domain-containing protein [Zunongwangia sp. F260]